VSVPPAQTTAASAAAAVAPAPTGADDRGRAAVAAGDDTGASVVYVCLGGDGRLVRSRSLRELLRASGRADLEVDPDSLSHLLHDGFVPSPRTIFRDVFALGIGDRVALVERGGRPRLRFVVDFPFLGRHSAEDQEPDPRRLLRLLCASLERNLAGRGRATLMMSSGLDSVPLGLAAAEIGRAGDVTALTFDQHGDGEGDAAAAFAKRFGLRHAIVGFPDDRREVAEMVATFFAAADQPCCDPVTLAYVAALRRGGGGAPVIIDGGGSDVYLGGPVTRRARLLDVLHRRGLPDGWIGPVRAAVPFWSPLNKVASSRCEKTFVDEYHLRHRETSRLFAGSVDTSARWRERDRRETGLAVADLSASVAGRHHDANCSLLKARLAAAAQGAEAVFPWCDADLIDYCFNLPDRHRRGLEAGENKPLVRLLLRQHAGYDSVTRRKKVIFSFALREFLRANRALVEHEVLSCRLWAPAVGRTTAMLWRAMEERRGTAAALHALFAASAWLNHADILARDGRAGDLLGRAAEGGRAPGAA
jgi:asparagine synthase (glutamine-hydrolysing)